MAMRSISSNKAAAARASSTTAPSTTAPSATTPSTAATSSTTAAVQAAKDRVAAFRAKWMLVPNSSTNFGTWSAEWWAVKKVIKSKTSSTANNPTIVSGNSSASTPIGNTSSKIIAAQNRLKIANENKTLSKQLASPVTKTWLEETDKLITDIKWDQNENIDFINMTKMNLLEQNKKLQESLNESNKRQQDIIQERRDSQDQNYNTIMSTINEWKNIDIDKLNLTTNQNAQALSTQLSDQWLLNSEQAAQASATVISKANEATQLKKLDIDQKTNELIIQANQEFQSKRDAILAQQWVNESTKATQIAELNKNYTSIVETYNNNALNEKKTADSQETALTQWLSGAEIAGQQAEIVKETQAKAKLNQLEASSRSPEDKAVYLFSTLSSYFGSDVITDWVINWYINRLRENGTLASVPLSTIFTAIKDQIISAQKSLKK